MIRWLDGFLTSLLSLVFCAVLGHDWGWPVQRDLIVQPGLVILVLEKRCRFCNCAKTIIETAVHDQPNR